MLGRFGAGVCEEMFGEAVEEVNEAIEAALECSGGGNFRVFAEAVVVEEFGMSCVIGVVVSESGKGSMKSRWVWCVELVWRRPSIPMSRLRFGGGKLYWRKAAVGVRCSSLMK
jgi:hypothetical protein